MAFNLGSAPLLQQAPLCLALYTLGSCLEERTVKVLTTMILMAMAFLSAEGALLPTLCAASPLLRNWPRLLPSQALRLIPPICLSAGPFGTGGSKVLMAAVVLALERPPWGQLPSLEIFAVIICGGTFLTFVVLQLWARWAAPKYGRMGELKRAVSAKQQPWTLQLVLKVLGLAVANGIAEESVFRGLFLPRLAKSGLGDLKANLSQAISFGIFHWNGIPSGPSGVALTFVYGAVMGWLFQICGGLGAPVLAHSAADFFIFAVLVRRVD